MLLPPDLKEWLGDNDLVHFILEVCEQLDPSKAHLENLRPEDQKSLKHIVIDKWY